MRAVVLAQNACFGDAIGNRIAAKVRFLIARGWQVRVFVESTHRLHPALRDGALQTDAASLWRCESQRRLLGEAELLLVEYGGSFGLWNLLPALPRPRPRLIVEYHGLTPPEQWPSADRWRLEASRRDRDLIWCADRVTVLSRFAQEELHAATGYPAHQTRCLPGFVEPHDAPPRASDVRRRFGLRDAFILLFVGRLAANKRPAWVIDAVHRLRDLGRPVHAVFIGPCDDVYAREAEQCRALAEALGVADRVHFRGWVEPKELDAWYRSADVLVVPSVHEGFCLPVIEAMKRGLPVVAARAAALPETVGSAGLTFEPDDEDDLIRQIRRVLTGDEPNALNLAVNRRLAVVIPRFGTGFAGGAERSLACLATAMMHRGWQVEIFTTTAHDESGWQQRGRPGEERHGSVLVHRFPVQPGDPERLRRYLRTSPRQQSARNATVSDLLTALPRSPELVAALEQRRNEFAAIFVGPYNHGLAWQIALRLPEQTVLVPCLHDEPLAWQAAWLKLCRQVAAILYHAPEERGFAERCLGINHPVSEVMGTVIAPAQGEGKRARSRCGSMYVLYCGRCLPEKGFDQLVNWMRRYHREHASPLKLAVIGRMHETLPPEDWLVDWGFVSEAEKADAMAGASALVQLSVHESLSLAVLEAWNQGTPVIVASQCEVLAGQVARSGGGLAISSYDQFAAALRSLETEPETWRRRGQAGRCYVEAHYRSAEAFAQRIEKVVELRRRPLQEVLAEAGRKRAAEFTVDHWERRFAALLDEVMAMPRPESDTLSVRLHPPASEIRVGSDAQEVLLPIRVENVGSRPVPVSGPASLSLIARIEGCPQAMPSAPAPVSAVLRPGAETAVNLRIPVPRVIGTYQVHVEPVPHWIGTCEAANLALHVAPAVPEPRRSQPLPPRTLQEIRRLLAELHRLANLPDDYVDVSHGPLAEWKKRIKHKLLHNFRTAYVDVLSRQQSQFNELLLHAMARLTEVSADQAPATLGPADASSDRLVRRLRREQARLRRRLARLEKLLDERAGSRA